MLLFRKILSVLFIFCLALLAEAQPVKIAAAENSRPAKPYRILTAGKQVTIKSSKDIKSVLVWTAGGHRILEQKDVNAASFNFRISVNEKVFFIMLRLTDGKTYSEKIGVQ